MSGTVSFSAFVILGRSVGFLSPMLSLGTLLKSCVAPVTLSDDDKEGP